MKSRLPLRLQLPHRLSRRAFLRSAAVGASGLIGAYLLGCGNDGSSDLNDLWELNVEA